MTRGEFEKKAEKIFQDCLSISKGKQSDYCANADPFDNLRKSELCGASIEQGIFTRLADKFSRVGSLIKKMNSVGEGQRILDESLQDTLDDLINYTMLLKIYLEEKYDGQTAEQIK
jgi:hypothetical protein